MHRSGSRSPDVVIVGGGVIGCACAWELARNGVRTVVLERSVPGAEASSAAAGLLGAHIESEEPGPMAELCRKSAGRYPSFARRLKEETEIDVEYRRCGILSVAFRHEALAALQREYAWQIRAGFRVEKRDAAALLRAEPGLGRKLAGGLCFEDDARVDPRRLLTALHLAAAKRGVGFQSGTYVRRVLAGEGTARGVELEDGSRLLAGHVVIAAGSWTTLIDGLDMPERSVIPARGQIIELQAETKLRHVVFGPHCYLVPRDDGRVLVGSTLEFVGYRKQVTAAAAHRLLGAAIRLVPALGGATLSGHWSNFRPYTPDRLPLLGATSVPRTLLATGHFRTGILLAPITAEIIGALVRGKRPPLSLEPFEPRRRRTRREN
jgi:glycine oxidase